MYPSAWHHSVLADTKARGEKWARIRLKISAAMAAGKPSPDRRDSTSRWIASLQLVRGGAGAIVGEVLGMTTVGSVCSQDDSWLSRDQSLTANWSEPSTKGKASSQLRTWRFLHSYSDAQDLSGDALGGP